MEMFFYCTDTHASSQEALPSFMFALALYIVMVTLAVLLLYMVSKKAGRKTSFTIFYIFIILLLVVSHVSLGLVPEEICCFWGCPDIDYLFQEGFSLMMIAFAISGTIITAMIVLFYNVGKKHPFRDLSGPAKVKRDKKRRSNYIMYYLLMISLMLVFHVLMGMLDLDLGEYVI
ncbi:MAG: hypothetical protein ACFFCS_07360 [Candidatus Hodarchaeota archaeon]